MRGKVSVSRLEVVSVGITPAYAGKRFVGTETASLRQDHPRLCGEKFADNRYIYIKVGSPPPMRGKAHGSICHLRHHRITPAYAGKRVLLTAGKL